MATLVQVLHS